MIYILDTNLLIYYLQGISEVEYIFDKIETEQILGKISIISKIELLGFSSLSRNEDVSARKLISNLEIVGVDDFIAEEAVRLRKQYKIKTPDAIIASTALFYNAPLVTADANFKKIKNLEIINPFK
jgi:predicted nucleic acid-binding protein